MRRASSLHVFVAPLVALGLGGCGHDHDHDHDHDDIAEELCFHMQNGPANAIALPDLEAGVVADISEEHTRFDITLQGEPGAHVGVVRFEAGDAGEYVITMSRDIPLVVFNAANQAVDPESETVDVSRCSDDIRFVAVYDLEAGANQLSIGPAATADISIVIERKEHGGHSHSH